MEKFKIWIYRTNKMQFRNFATASLFGGNSMQLEYAYDITLLHSRARANVIRVCTV